MQDVFDGFENAAINYTTDMSGHACTCLGMLGYAYTCFNMCGHDRECQDMPVHKTIRKLGKNLTVCSIPEWLHKKKLRYMQ